MPYLLQKIKFLKICCQNDVSGIWDFEEILKICKFEAAIWADVKLDNIERKCKFLSAVYE